MRTRRDALEAAVTLQPRNQSRLITVLAQAAIATKTSGRDVEQVAAKEFRRCNCDG
jgi:hypothetical protein